jgi:hypothetical protein
MRGHIGMLLCITACAAAKKQEPQAPPPVPYLMSCAELPYKVCNYLIAEGRSHEAASDAVRASRVRDDRRWKSEDAPSRNNGGSEGTEVH